MRHKVNRLIFAVTIAVHGLAIAQTPPDAGVLRQEIERQLPSLQPTLPTPEIKPLPAPMNEVPGDLNVREFRFAGNTLIASEALSPVVQPWLNTPISFGQLQQAAMAVAQAYRQAGWVVRAYLPRQDITEGVVTIQIVEAIFGGVEIDPTPAERIDPEHLRGYILGNQTPGQPLDANKLDRALLILTDLPGVTVQGGLRPGKNESETLIGLQVADRPLLSGDLGFDNTGSRSTGREKYSFNVNFNGPFRWADQANANLMHTEGSDYLRLAYAFPLGHDGWRAGINGSLMRYQLVGENSPPDTSGASDSFGLTLNYPILRSRLTNLNFSGTLDHKGFDNQSNGATTTRYHIDVLSIGLNASRGDTLAGGGMNSLGVTLSTGMTDLNGSPNQAADASTTDTHGGFAKLRLNASRMQVITEQLTANISLTGQYANRNLDSSERFYLGGSSGIRAFPSSEGGGSEGAMANLELRWRIDERFTLTGFYDWGTVRVNRNNDFVGGATLNRFSLDGAGLSLAWMSSGGTSVKAVWSRRLGDNPSPSANGTDGDGTLIEDRVWLTAAHYF